MSLLWLNILIFLHQNPRIITMAHTYFILSLPELLTHTFLHPIRIYLRVQGVTHPVSLASLLGTLLHFPLNYVIVTRLGQGIVGVAATSNFSILLFLLLHVSPRCAAPTRNCLSSWKPLLRLVVHSCVSVCLKWRWYEIMIILCGLLVHPTVTVASMGILIQTILLIYVFPSSLGFTVSTHVENKLGANHPSCAQLSAVVNVFLVAIMGFSAMFFAIMMRRWGRIFTDEENIIRITSMALPILGICELINYPQTVGCKRTTRPNSTSGQATVDYSRQAVPVPPPRVLELA
ncbi:hypothetical protein Fmac_013790 [Flemingia macrophylla]|uniref:Uncharacterized protein n=1 Tax=Flemingia macrophylla TaxID=520843 RepID=A0ABD1MU57_9FABA